MSKYPQPLTTLEHSAKQLFDPVKNHLCVAYHFIPGSGKRTLIKFLLREEKILKTLFGNAYSKTLFVWIDPDEILEDNNRAYLQLLLDQLLLTCTQKKITVPSLPSTNPLILLKHALQNLISDGWHTVFLLNDFEYTLSLSPSIFRNLEGILSLNKPQITFVFLSSINLLDEEIIDRFHNLKYAINRVVRYHPLLSKEETSYVVKQFADVLKLKTAYSLVDFLFEQCGGHIQLLKYSMHILADSDKENLQSVEKARELLLTHPQLKTICHDIWSFLQKNEQNAIINVLKTSSFPLSPPSTSDFLLQTGLVNKISNTQTSLFANLFKEHIKEKLPQEKITLDTATNQLYLGDTNISNRFTLQEYRLLVYLVRHINTVISRDEAAQAMWGKDSFDKYSDWTIDKTVSTIRKKLIEAGLPQNKFTTLKKRGFCLSQ